MERSRSFSQKSNGSGDNSAYVTDLRCHSASYVSSYAPPREASRVKKEKAAAWPSSASSSSSAAAAAGPKAARVWGGLGDPDLQRKRRVAGYSAYGMEGKVKGSLKSSMRWLKCKCTQVVDGWW